MTKRTLVLCLTAIAFSLLTDRGSAQSQDPHLPPPRSLPSLNEFIQIDDMLLWPEQYQGLMTPPRNHGQSNFRPGRDPVLQWFWDFGVIPYEIAPNFSDAEKLRIRAVMDTWSRTAPVVFVPRTTQTGFLPVTRDELSGPEASPCFAILGYIFNAVTRLNLGAACWNGV